MKHMGIRSMVAALAMAAMLVFALFAAGCQSEGDDQAEPATDQAAEQAATDAETADGASSDETAAYTYKLCVLERYGDDVEGAAGEPRFSYLKFQGPTASEAVGSLNEELQNDAESAFKAKLTDEIANNPTDAQLIQEYYEELNYACTYLDGSLACITRTSYTTHPQAAHGMPIIEGKLYDLEKGREVSAADFVGLKDKELGALTWQAADRFLAANGDLFGSAEEAFPDVADAVIPKDAVSYCITPEGVIAVFEPYTLGSFAMGMPTLLVCDLDGNPAEADGAVDLAPLPTTVEEDVSVG